MVDGDEGLITARMLGLGFVFGADAVLLVGLLWLGGVLPLTAFLGVTGLVVAVFLGWVASRWLSLRGAADGEADPEWIQDETERTTNPDPVETAQRRYAAGELDDETYEATVDRLTEDVGDGRVTYDEDADPVELLKRRYAAGELSDEEFESKVERIVSTDPDDESEAVLLERES